VAEGRAEERGLRQLIIHHSQTQLNREEEIQCKKRREEQRKFV